MKGFTGIIFAGNKAIQQQVKIMQLSALSLAMATIFSVPAFAADSNDGVPTPASELGNTPAKATGSGSTPNQASESLLDTLIITATKSSDPHTKTELGKLTEETPVAGSVLSRKIIDEVQYVDALRELSGMVPGLSIVRNMRIPEGSKNYTDMRVNGLRVAYNQTLALMDQSNMTNVDHVDFINGPGTAINSSYAVGGTINVVTLDPPKSLEAKAQQELGSFGLNRTQANVGNTLSNGAGFTLSASNMDYAGSRANSSSQQKKEGVGGGFMIRPNDNSKLIIALDTLHFDYRLANALNPTQFNSDWQQAGVYGRSDTNYNTDSVRYQLLFGDRAELNLAASQRTTATTGYGNTGSGQSPLSPVYTIAALNEVDNAYQAVYRKEFDLAQSTFNAGVEITDASVDSTTYNNVFSNAQSQLGYWGLGSVNSKGSLSAEHDKTPFVQYEFTPLDKVRFSLGERFDRINDTINNRVTPTQSISGTSFDKNVFKGGVTFDYAPGQLVWGNLSQGFLAPALAALSGAGAGATATLAAPNLLPENDLTQEIGFRGKLEANKLRYDIALYHSTIQNIAVTRNLTAADIAAGGAYHGYLTTNAITENAGSLTARGLESQLSWNATQKLELASSYTWAEAISITTFPAQGRLASTSRDIHINACPPTTSICGLLTCLWREFGCSWMAITFPGIT